MYFFSVFLFLLVCQFFLVASFDGLRPLLVTSQCSIRSLANKLRSFVRIDFCIVTRSDNFVVGLSNVSPNDTAPTLWNYTVCGQYPGAVAGGATVYQRCDSCLPAFRYVIVQFPTTNFANFCELEVYARGKYKYYKHLNNREVDGSIKKPENNMSM